MRILIAGDYRPSGKAETCFEMGDFNSMLGEVKDVASKADYGIINLEAPVVLHDAVPIIKCGPALKSKACDLDALKWAGFNCVTLANNHFRDYGEGGVKDTIASCNGLGIDTVGGGDNLKEASQILYKEVAGKRLAIINCCENEFSIATESSAGSNPLNPIRQYYDIQEARKKADRVLVIVHGGIEHFKLPSPRMVETYRFFIDAGADAVVNHHQHCYSGYEVYKDRPIFYGLGNFFFFSSKDRSGQWTEGYAVIIDFSDAIPSFQLYPYIQNAEEWGVFFKNADYYDSDIHEINSIIASPLLLSKEVEKSYEKSIIGVSNIFEPFRNKFYLYAKEKGWLPSMISKERFLLTKNVVKCESHLDKLKWWLDR